MKNIIEPRVKTLSVKYRGLAVENVNLHKAIDAQMKITILGHDPTIGSLY